MDIKEKRRFTAKQCLENNNVEFEVKNNGCHLIVSTDIGLVDFWPGTELFEIRATKERDYGLDNLVKLPLRRKSYQGIHKQPVKAEDATLRDRFASWALTGILSNNNVPVSAAARDAYQFADAMMRERAK